MKKAVLLSGGLDSALIAARWPGSIAISIDYGQAHKIELNYARRLAEKYCADHVEISIPIVPAKSDVVFECRNAALASVGAMVAATHGCENLMIGCNFSDFDRFPDCRPHFWRELSRTFELGEYPVKLRTPLLYMTKKEIVKDAKLVGLDLGETWSCYEPQGDSPCGKCLSCKVRYEAGA